MRVPSSNASIAVAQALGAALTQVRQGQNGGGDRSLRAQTSNALQEIRRISIRDGEDDYLTGLAVHYPHQSLTAEEDYWLLPLACGYLAQNTGNPEHLKSLFPDVEVNDRECETLRNAFAIAARFCQTPVQRGSTPFKRIVASLRTLG